MPIVLIGSNTHMLQSGIQNGWGELMPINIKIWCTNKRSVMSQPLSIFFNDCFVNKTIMNLCT